MSERSDPNAGLVIPDLELEPAVSKRPTPSPARAAAPRAPAKTQGLSHGAEIDLGGDGDDDFELVATGSAMELATGSSAAEPTRQPASAAWPTGRSRSADQLAIDPLEVALVAGYGAAPQSDLLTPAYAYRVYARRRLLQRAVSAQNAALTAEEAERDAALAELASGLRPTLQASDAFRRLLEPSREVARLAGERSAAFSEADAGFREHMAKFDQELNRLAEASAGASAVASEKAARAQSSDGELRRAEAKHQRVQIEIRGVLDLARQALGPAGGDIPTPQAAQLAELQARSTALEPELARARAASSAASAEAHRAEDQLRRLQTQTRQLEREKATASGSLSQQLSVRAAGVSEAEPQPRLALAEVARAVLAARGGVAVPEATLQALRAHDARVDSQAIRLETHVRALDSHDHQRVRRGVILTLSALGLVVLAIALKAVL
jgi:hypothetical protein